MRLIPATKRQTCPLCRGEFCTVFDYVGEEGRYEHYCPFCGAPLVIVVETVVTVESPALQTNAGRKP